MRREAWAKALGLMAVGLGLTVVLARIDWLVTERQARQQEAQEQVAQATAGPQLIAGPYLRRECTEEWTAVETTDDARGKLERRSRQRRDFALRNTPASLQVQGELKPQQLERGLFKVNTFVAPLHLSARWDSAPDLSPRSDKLEGSMRCGPVAITLDVSDARGLRSVGVLAQGAALNARPGNGSGGAGLHAVLPPSPAQPEGPLQVDLRLELLGTESLRLLPAANAVQAQIRSAWPHPSFHGRFLPVDRNVNDTGFTATWRVTELASTAAADLRAGKASEDLLGVSLIDPVSPYSLSDRALKYGFLFIALTLAAVMLAELLGRHRLHPVQYGFVGLALALFFLLLLALSEHLAFGIAYALAAAAASTLLAHYGRGLFGHWRGGALLGAGVALLYGALYVVLNLEKASLLLGTLLLFALLAAAMRATRDVDWYRLGQPAAH
ncbi:cell envelope integrity protein CreD [Inhella crocodyli]|uniref:Cell envelope integrity protein CreD n=1 Tax=Inhella crocodyli TaxID=2499851 RepID=A0A437LE03_9BURK|nr:cell envelope integrity protein CreD [Inhella crocodyli]RVT83600.1 cell envelope integrity protein CreD [Inhella crocodyli]